MKKFRKKIFAFLSLLGLTASGCVVNTFAYEKPLNNNLTYFTRPIGMEDDQSWYDTIICGYEGFQIEDNNSNLKTYFVGTEAFLECSFKIHFNSGVQIATGDMIHFEVGSYLVSSYDYDYENYTYTLSQNSNNVDYYFDEFQASTTYIQDFNLKVLVPLGSDFYNTYNVNWDNDYFLFYYAVKLNGFSVSGGNATSCKFVSGSYCSNRYFSYVNPIWTQPFQDYSEGLNNGWYEGYRQGQLSIDQNAISQEAYNKGLEYASSHLDVNSESYRLGVIAGQDSQTSIINLRDTIMTIFDTPYQLLHNMFNVNFLGYSISDIVIGLVFTCLVIWIIKHLI